MILGWLCCNLVMVSSNYVYQAIYIAPLSHHLSQYHLPAYCLFVYGRLRTLWDRFHRQQFCTVSNKSKLERSYRRCEMQCKGGLSYFGHYKSRAGYYYCGHAYAACVGTSNASQQENCHYCYVQSWYQVSLL